MQQPEQRNENRPAPAPASDPRALSLPERRSLAKSMRSAQQAWQRRLADLVEPPAPAEDFPAFLLETPAFRELNRRIGEASRRSQLPIAVADELQHFVDAFRDYLRTCAGEDVFAAPVRSNC
jgi:hypothetical protein